MEELKHPSRIFQMTSIICLAVTTSALTWVIIYV